MVGGEGCKFILRSPTFGEWPEVEITKDEYEAFRSAKDFTIGALGREEDLNLVLGNYVELEERLLRDSLYSNLFTVGTWSEFSGTMHEVNRRLMNVLSGCRGYLDRTDHFLRDTYGKDSSNRVAFNEARSDQYDAALGFRAMEGLRNYSQHRGLAVHGVSHQRWMRQLGSERVRRSALVPTLDAGRLEEDGGFKASVLAELKEGNDVIDLRPLVRQYVGGIAAIHEVVRDLLGERTETDERLLRNAVDRYARVAVDYPAIAAIHCASDGTWISHTHLFLDPIERRHELAKRTRNVAGRLKMYITNEPKSATVDAPNKSRDPPRDSAAR